MKDVSNESQVLLRERGLIGEHEVAHVQGDLLVVVNVVDQTRRVLGPAVNFLNESLDRRILKG
jgi:hypothetical protein